MHRSAAEYRLSHAIEVSFGLQALQSAASISSGKSQTQTLLVH